MSSSTVPVAFVVGVTAVAAIAGFVAAVAVNVLLRRQGQQIESHTRLLAAHGEEIRLNQESTVAKFDQLTTDLADLKTEVGAVADRVESALEAATSDDADQAAVNAAHQEIRSAIDSLRSVAQAPTPEPNPEPGPAPEPDVA